MAQSKAYLLSNVFKPLLVRVRCLGYGREHTFLSDDKFRHRICNQCVKRQEWSQQSKLRKRVEE